MTSRPERTDSLIREKVNSLDSLPDGYAPSLDSKWELLMAAREPERNIKQRLFYFYSAVAACFLLVLLSGILLVKEHNQPSQEVAITSGKPLPAMAETQEPTTRQKAAPTAAKVTGQPSIDQGNQVYHTGRPGEVINNKKAYPALRKEIKQAEVQAVEDMQAQTDFNRTEIDLPAEPGKMVAHAATEETRGGRKRKKARSIEITFEDALAPAPAKHDPQMARQGLEFKFFSKPAGDNVAKNESPLKVQHTF